MNNRRTSNTQSVRVSEARGDRGRSENVISRRAHRPQQQTTEEIVMQIKELQEKLNYQIRKQKSLSVSFDNLQKLFNEQEGELKDLREHVHRFKLKSSKIDVALDWVVRVVGLVQEHLQGQHQEERREDNDDASSVSF
ncbi:unnamed protein product [Rotaria magnacalcarata]|uniref:Uncharacterized protein n=1 Tax=Rotaria magnacalcarata TaxID=392030 RepID=A0A820GCQ5_9BILA|nr:unnamed protein product [Rotaria magnacalcarata]